ncbi:hypothetical protein HU200_019862 [Digitaria exilis]|uniref:DUF7595 domain-containing protein n=1 Tax=Digitaria exilis TaxID=1010633 RepID=A0A835KHQ1_9POAL|nr:hypothetical protein HU200_019862 [Digitaria exilis]
MPPSCGARGVVFWPRLRFAILTLPVPTVDAIAVPGVSTRQVLHAALAPAMLDAGRQAQVGHDEPRVDSIHGSNAIISGKWWRYQGVMKLQEVMPELPRPVHSMRLWWFCEKTGLVFFTATRGGYGYGPGVERCCYTFSLDTWKVDKVASNTTGGPEFKGQFVLLVGDGEGNGAIGRPFKVLNVASVAVGLWYRERRHCFKFRTFSSERGTWGPSTRRWAPGRHKYSYCSLPPLPGRHLVLGDAVHWLYRHRWHDTYYVFKLDVGDDGEAGLTTSTMLPPSFHSECEDPRPGTQKILLAETAGSLVVLVANHGRISAWTMSEDEEAWTDKPQVVIGYEAMKRFGNVQESSDMGIVQLDWFAERTGIVQVTTKHCGFFWLHLQSKKIIRHFQGSLYTRSCPYYMDLSSWFPTLTL